MKYLSATQAARGFSQLLDAVEHRNETFVINRGGKAVAHIGPAGGRNGKAVKKLLRSTPEDKTWSSDLRELRAHLEGQERSWPD